MSTNQSNKPLAKILFATLFSIGMMFGMTGCAPDGPMEEVGEDIDQAVDDVADEIEDAGDEVEDHVG